MPLCSACRGEAMVTSRGSDRARPRGRREETVPPHGMEWGDVCDGCDVEAGVTFDA